MLEKLTLELKLWTEAFLGACPGKIGFRLREAWYSRRFGQAVGRVSIGFGPTVVSPETISLGDAISFGDHAYIGAHQGSLKIGSNCSFSRNVFLGADFGHIEIGNDVLIAMNVVLRAANHRTDLIAQMPIRKQGHVEGSIIVGDDVWIGANAVLIAGAKIGAHSVIAAGAVVTGEIPPYSVAGGVPAKVISSLTPS